MDVAGPGLNQCLSTDGVQQDEAVMQDIIQEVPLQILNARAVRVKEQFNKH